MVKYRRRVYRALQQVLRTVDFLVREVVRLSATVAILGGQPAVHVLLVVSSAAQPLLRKSCLRMAL
jgi:hypothetical protein